MLTLMDSSMIMDSTLEHVEKDDPVKRGVIYVYKIKRHVGKEYKLPSWFTIEGQRYHITILVLPIVNSSCN